MGGAFIYRSKTAVFFTIFCIICLLSSCNYDGAAESSENEKAPQEAVSSSAAVSPEFVDEWDGSVLTADNAKEQGYLFLGENDDESDEAWDSFCGDVEDKKECEITVCTCSSITKISNVRNSSGGEFQIRLSIRTSDNGVTERCERVISPAVIYTVENDGILEYYTSDQLLYTKAAEDGEEDHVDTPFESRIYPVSPDANMTFPYQKRFSSFSDFGFYFEKYNGELDLAELNADMESFNDEGGFNAHVVFLYGDMEGSEDISFEFLRAVRVGSKLYFYVKKTIPPDKSGNVAKWQLTAAVSGEYLDKVDPDGINWVIFSDSLE